MAKTKGVKGIRLRFRDLPSGHRQQYLDIHRNGKRWTEPVPFGMLTGNRIQDAEAKIRAEEYLRKRIADFSLQYGINKAKQGKENFSQYCQKCAEERSTHNTRKSWATAIKHLREFAGENLTFADLSRPVFEKFRDYLLNTANLSPNSALIYTQRIRAAVHQAIDENILAYDPSARVSIKKTKSLRVHLSFEEIQKLADTPCANPDVKRAFLFAAFSGLRFGDVDNLTWDKVKDGHIEFVQQKTVKPEDLPLSEEAQRILNEQRDVKPSSRIRREFRPNQVFFLPSHSGVDQVLKKWGRNAGIEKRLSFHKSRHSFATLELTMGVDIFTVQKLLGHTDLRTTQLYAQLIDEKKKQAVAMLPRLRDRASNSPV